MNKLSVLLDMDGVVADFIKGVCNLFAINYPNLYRDYSPATFNMAEEIHFKELGITNRKIYDALDAEGESFWTNLNSYDGARGFYNQLCSLVGSDNVVFSTSPSSQPECTTGKIKWLQQFTRKKSFKNFMVGHHKYLMAKPNILLVDDKEENVYSFLEAGGKAYLFPRPWNYKGIKDPKESYKEVLNFVENLMK